MDRTPPRHEPAHSAPSRPSRPAAPEGPAPGSSAVTSVISWVRGHLVPVATAAVLAAGLVIAGVVFLVGNGKPASTASHTEGTVAAQAAHTVTKGSKWLGSSAAKQISVVNLDVARVMTAERAGHGSAAAKAAGARLAADAGTALSGPVPPVAAKVYRAALQRLAAAGSSAASGKYGPKAAHLLDAGEAGLMKVTAAADAPVPLKTPAIPEPNS